MKEAILVTPHSKRAPRTATKTSQSGHRQALDERSARDRILDVAEQKFAQFGYYGTSIRSITTEAAIDLSMVNYHFGGKDGLFTAVIERRTYEINDAIMNNLRSLPKNASADLIVYAYIDATIDKLADGGRQWRDYLRLSTQAGFLEGKRDLIAPMAAAHLKVEEYCLELLVKALPGADHDEIAAIFHAMGLATARIADEDALPRRVDACVPLPGYREYGRLIAQTFAAGFEKLLAVQADRSN